MAATVTVPLVLIVRPVGTEAVTVNFTSPGFVPITACAAFTVSPAINETVVVPPAFPFMDPRLSATASIDGATTEIETVAVLQFEVFKFSQIV